MPSSLIPTGILSSRNYPGFLGALFLVLLRIAIGWHFLIEGLDKIESTRYGKQPFSAEVYLRNSVGPLAPQFRRMLPDADGRALLDPAQLKSGWSETIERIANHYKFTDDQKSKAKALLEQGNAWADVWFNAYDNREAREKYLSELTKVEQTERNPDALSYERERAWETRRTLEGDRKKLTAPLVAKGQELADAVVALKTPEQQASAGNYSASLELPGCGELADDVRALRDRRLPDPGVPDSAGCHLRGGLPGAALSLHSALAGLAAQPQGRGALLDRQQEPGRADRLPAHRRHGQRPLVRPRCALLRCTPPAPLGAVREQAGGRSTASRQRQLVSDREPADN